MRKKDSQQNNAHSSKVSIILTKQFIINSAFKHFERIKIDTPTITNFINLIHTISIKIIKNSSVSEMTDLFKITNELIIGFLANLADETYRHTCTYEDIISFFIVLASYFEKTVNAFGVG